MALFARFVSVFGAFDTAKVAIPSIGNGLPRWLDGFIEGSSLGARSGAVGLRWEGAGFTRLGARPDFSGGAMLVPHTIRTHHAAKGPARSRTGFYATATRIATHATFRPSCTT